MDDSSVTPAQDRPWLLFIHQVPPKPDYLRVKIRRRLRGIGAQQLKNAVYAIAHSAEALEDLQWIRQEILEMGGSALICEASFLTPAGNAHAAREVTPGTVWVTRAGVYVDRIASAWLIRRFIDPEAQFKFVAARDYEPAAGEVRFDMYEAEFTHEGERCTFQTLVRHFVSGDVALHALGEIVRDIDLKAEHFARAETAGVAALIRGVADLHADDMERVQRGGEILDVLYAALSNRGS